MQTLQGARSLVHALSFSGDGAYLASAAGQAQVISLWDLRKGTRSGLRFHRVRVDLVRFAPKAPYLLSADRRVGGRIWSADAEGVWASQALVSPLAAFVGEGSEVACAQADVGGNWYLGYVASDFPGKDGTLVPLGRLNVGRWILFGSPAGRDVAVIATEWRTYALVVVLIRPGASPVTRQLTIASTPHDAAFTPDGRTLAVATTDAVQRWDVATTEPLPSLRGHTRLIRAVAYLPDGRLLTCSNDGTVRTWDGDQCVDVKDWQLGELTALAVASDGMRAAVGNRTGTILIWDVD
jgi:WD40 repeat protein